MKISIFLPKLTAGGVERNLLRLSSALAKKGCVIELVIVSLEGELADTTGSAATVHVLNGRLGSGRLVFSAWQLKKYLNKSKPDVLLSAMTQANVTAIIASLLARHRPWLVVSERSDITAKLMGTGKKWALRVAVRMLYRLPDRIHAVSDGVRGSFSSWAGVPLEKIITVYSPIVDSSIFKMADSALRADIKTFWQDAPRKMVAVGRLTPAKDYPTLLRALEDLPRGYAKLVIAGSGPLEADIKAMALDLGLNEDVYFAGYLQNPYPLISAADVFVLSSAWEGFPTVIVEALSLGKYIISTDCRSGPSEILSDPRFGTLVPAGDWRSFARAIRYTFGSGVHLSDIEARVSRAFSLCGKEASVREFQRLLLPGGPD